MNRKACIAIVFAWLTMVVFPCLTMQSAYGQQNFKTDALKRKAIQLLNGLKEATPVSSTDNLLELSVDSVKKTRDGYDVYLKCHNNRVKNSGSGTVMATYFIDPENYKNYYRPVTINDKGFMNFTFTSTTDETAIIHVKLKPPSGVMYVYFSGVKEPADLYTAPLFFTIVLGNEPFVLEQTPRHARTLFDKSLEKKK